ncbi:TlyA family RNA methyltransferase [Aquitalea aquatica]|uniref:TlyA family RNA methyltransferase n=1 Tax=Aquitalea aquatica TaxID=3044273 RepID=A0A838Y3C7_9NEIS|nr:TlyA family RNA methyltransferase [Aquitalea magnusonii]MBA4709823.1 TlyA family RNA methyltransferase [Aquitalea magnusonii]
MKRVDLLLVEQGLATSRTAAQSLLESGRVSLDGQVISKASSKFPAGTPLQVRPDPADRFVSRGGQKLDGALRQAGLDITGWRVLDVGQSTGGFTDCALQAGAEYVVGVDVGHDQLHPRLWDDPRVRCFEGVNARALDSRTLLQANDGQPFDLMVCDVSFISLTLILPSALPLLGENGRLLGLVKPQFEVGRGALGHGGIVRDESLFAGVQEKISNCLDDLDWEVEQWFDSPLTGADGNREFFVLARRAVY